MAMVVVMATLAPAHTAAAAPELGPCIARLRASASQYRQVRPDTFERYTQRAQDLRSTIQAASRSQPEFQLPVWDYLARLVDQRRIDDGLTVMAHEATHLNRLALQYGVDMSTVVAIFGIESDFGRLKGKFGVVDATLARACLNLSIPERKAHFFAALWLLQEGLVEAESFNGSWAGAFGMTQFMPGTYTRYMTDGDGDGRIDTLRSRVDALATTARYLKSLGWTAGLPWGIEVRVPESIARSSSSSQTEHACLAATDATGRCKRLDHWASLGLRRVDGRPLLGVSDDARIDWPALGPDTPLALLTPAGPQGPAWLVSRNFQSLWRYNRADAYALAVGQLSSALRGDAAQQSAWPGPDAALALSRNGTAELQGLLIAQGHCNLTADGYDGPATRLAVAG